MATSASRWLRPLDVWRWYWRNPRCRSARWAIFTRGILRKKATEVRGRAGLLVKSGGDLPRPRLGRMISKGRIDCPPAPGWYGRLSLAGGNHGGNAPFGTRPRPPRRSPGRPGWRKRAPPGPGGWRAGAACPAGGGLPRHRSHLHTLERTAGRWCAERRHDPVPAAPCLLRHPHRPGGQGTGAGAHPLLPGGAGAGRGPGDRTPAPARARAGTGFGWVPAATIQDRHRRSGWGGRRRRLHAPAGGISRPTGSDRGRGCPALRPAQSLQRLPRRHRAGRMAAGCAARAIRRPGDPAGTRVRGDEGRPGWPICGAGGWSGVRIRLPAAGHGRDPDPARPPRRHIPSRPLPPEPGRLPGDRRPRDRRADRGDRRFGLPRHGNGRRAPRARRTGPGRLPGDPPTGERVRSQPRHQAAAAPRRTRGRLSHGSHGDQNRRPGGMARRRLGAVGRDGHRGRGGPTQHDSGRPVRNRAQSRDPGRPLPRDQRGRHIRRGGRGSLSRTFAPATLPGSSTGPWPSGRGRSPRATCWAVRKRST